MKLNKLLLAGGSGFLGNAIIKHFRNSVQEVIVLTRGPERQDGNVRYLNWDGKTTGSWAKEIDSSDVVINLTGKSVDCRYTEKNKAGIISSRVNATKILGEIIRKSASPPKMWINAASATIYRNAEDKEMSESDGEMGSGFSVEVCKQWEDAFNKAHTPLTHKVSLRISMVLGRSGGVMPVLEKLVRTGLGGKMGSGNQYISWIHEVDFINAIIYFIQNHRSGVYNLAAPEPILNKDFMKLLRERTGMIIGLPATEWMLEIGAFVLRTETELVLKSRRVVPARLLSEGFTFRFNTAESAINDLVKK